MDYNCRCTCGVSGIKYPALTNARAIIFRSRNRRVKHGRTAYDWQHYIPLIQRKPGALRNGAPFAEIPLPFKALQRQLMRREGGDRVVAQVLAVVPKAGLEAVIVAVDLMLAGAGGGVPSAEYVITYSHA